MLVTTLTVALGTVSATALAEDDVTLAGGTQVTAFASEGDIDGGIAVETQAEQTAPEAEVAPQADTTDAEATAPEADATDAEAIAPEAEQTAPEAIAPEEVAPETIVPEQTVPEATAPEADTTVKDEVSTPEAKAITVDVATSSTTFDGTQDIVITYTINGAPEGLEPYGDIPNFGGVTGVHKEKVSDTVYRCTIPVSVQQKLIERDHPTDGQTYDLYSGYSIDEDFPTVTLTYTTGDNGDNGNGETPEKPENPDPDNGNGDNGNGETPEKPENPDPDNGNGDNNNGGDNGNGETPEKPENPDQEKPENPDNGNGDNQKPENPDNGDNQNPDGDNNQTPETPDNGDDNKDVQDWMTLTPAQKVTTTTQTQTPQTQTVSTTQTAPKTGDAASTLPLLGTGLTSLGVALGAIFKKRR